MATFTASPGLAARFDTWNIAGWIAGDVIESSSTSFATYDTETVLFEGDGFTYGSDGRFNGGIIASIYLNLPPSSWHSITGLSMPVATFVAFAAAGDTAGFLAAAFAGNDTIRGNSSVAADDFLDGFAGNDSIYGGGGNDTLRGGAGNDMLDGQAGADNMDGGAGSDSYHVDSALDVVVDSGVTGIDTVFTSIDIYALAAGVENLTLVDASLAAVGHGNGLNNKIVGNAYRNNLEGGDGNDTIFGGGGFDEINGDGGADRLYGDTNRDWLVGGSENDSLYGGADNDTLWGDAGTDRMYGQAGDDEYIGGAGTDVIDVGLGNDRAYHESVLDGRDLLLNFDGNASGGQDVLDISQLFVSLGVAVADRAARVQLVDRGASVDVKVDTNGDGGFDLFAATLQTADMVTVHQDVIVA